MTVTVTLAKGAGDVLLAVSSYFARIKRLFGCFEGFLTIIASSSAFLHVAMSQFLLAVGFLSIYVPSVLTAFTPRLSSGIENIILTSQEFDLINDTLRTFTQKVDHFDPNNKDTFLQRFGVNVSFYKPGGPAFILVGCEGTASTIWTHLPRSYWVDLAKEAGAMVFTLEHRFYGYSWPKPDLSPESLKFHTSRQALADLNAFILAQKVAFDLNNPKWITFGGSYGGSLSAWAREKYPDTIYAAVASSAPIEAVVDFSAFLEVVSDIFYNFDKICAQSIHRGFLAMQKELQTEEGQDKLNQIFDYHNRLKSQQEQYNFFNLIIDTLLEFIQYGDGGSGYATKLTKICQLQTADENNPVQGYANVYAFLRPHKPLLRSAVIKPDNGRTWIWQTCNEFGFFVTTNSKRVNKNFVPDVLPVNYSVDNCGNIFGDVFNNATVYSNVDSTNEYYHGRNKYNGTRVLFVNGKNDPWHALSILEPREGINAIVIEGAGHAADMLRSQESDIPAITAARKQIHAIVMKWVNE
uniref:Serine protease K12H4.7 n=1 Tax=Panagrellus redivivus TaxID=6233 RepID=A0A7E4W467_PANRE